MRVMIDDLEVLWPYDYIYPEQYNYMCKLYQSLQTVSLLSLILSYQYHKQQGKGKLVYCTRTVQEMDKVVEELRRVMAFREKTILDNVKQFAAQQRDSEEKQKHDASQPASSSSNPAGTLSLPPSIRDPRILGVCLSSRRNLCIHPDVSSFDNRNKVDALCRNLTASFIREQHAQGAGVPICEFYEGYEREGNEAQLLGVYSLADLKALGQDKGWCPYFYARFAINMANVVVYNYQYMLDPKISGLVSREMEKESIVVFDEAHNIDNICIEALSVELDARTVNAASGNLTTLTRSVKEMERTDAQRLQQEYNNLLRGLTGAAPRGGAHAAAAAADEASSSSSSSVSPSLSSATDALLSSPVLPSDVLREAVPGNIRRAKHFLLFLRSWVEYLKQRLLLTQVTQETPTAFLVDVQQATQLTDTKALRFSYDRLQSLFQTLKMTDLDDYTPLQTLTNFATLVATYAEGFMVIFEPYDERNPAIPDPKLQLCCLDASLAMKPVFERFHSVVITSGTLSPLDVYPKVLNFHPAVQESFSMSLSRNVICPLIVTKGSDQVPVTSKFDLRADLSVIQNYGRLLVDICSVVPDGVVGFFTSYRYMEDIVAAWKELGIIDQLLALKLIFIETKDIVETTLALDSYKRACTCGRGALFLSVARGKVAEGIDFDRHYGRCVLIFGIPFQYTLSRVLRARLEYLRQQFQLSEADFLSFDALRQTAQCVGRVIRSKQDYGLMIFADQRFSRVDKRNKLPKWITAYMEKNNLNLSTDRAVTIARDFLKRMAQPRSQKEDIGITMLSEEDIARRIARAKEAAEQMQGAEVRAVTLPTGGYGNAMDVS